MKSGAFYGSATSSPFPLRQKVVRQLWNLVWTLCYRPSPRALFAWRRWLLVCFGAQIDRSARIYQGTWVYAPWNLQMAAGSCLGDEVRCYNVDKVSLAVDSTVSQYAFLCTASHNIDSERRELVTAPISIERGAWVFASAFVGPGVTVGEGAVVAAAAVVVKSVEPFAVVGGNPAKFIRARKFQGVKTGEISDE